MHHLRFDIHRCTCVYFIICLTHDVFFTMHDLYNVYLRLKYCMVPMHVQIHLIKCCWRHKSPVIQQYLSSSDCEVCVNTGIHSALWASNQADYALYTNSGEVPSCRLKWPDIWYHMSQQIFDIWYLTSPESTGILFHWTWMCQNLCAKCCMQAELQLQYFCFDNFA